MGRFSAFFRDLPEQVESFLGIFFVEPGDREAGMDDDPIANPDVIKEGEIGLDLGSKIIDLSGPMNLIDLDDLRRYR
jgi:hypothetical protein